MTTEQPGPSMFARAESGSRQVVLQIGLGVVAFVLGSLMAAGASARISERIGPIENQALALGFGWLFERLWLFTAVPFFGYATGRFTQVTPVRFTLLAVLSGETFAVLLSSGINGFEYLVHDPANVVARLVTLFLGMLMTARAVQVGRDDAAEAQGEANAVAERRKAEYAAFLAAAEGKTSAAPEVSAETAKVPGSSPLVAAAAVPEVADGSPAAVDQTATASVPEDLAKVAEPPSAEDQAPEPVAATPSDRAGSSDAAPVEAAPPEPKPGA